MSASAPAEAEICVVGAGIVGLATARELQLRHPEATIAVLERAGSIAAEQSGHSSGVIHAGVYYEPGSLKARLCVDGSRRLYAFCEERAIPARRSGKVIVAASEADLPRLDELERRGRANDVPGLERIGADRLREIEPHAAGAAALHSPATGIVDFAAVAAAIAADFERAGGRLALGCEVRGLEPRADRLEIAHSGGRTLARRTAVCAGPWADRLAIAAGADRDPRLVPFRGAYLRLRPEADHLVRSNIYPVPDPDLPFLGVHLTRNAAGEVLLGPTALLVGARDAYRLRRIVPRDLVESVAWPGTWRMIRRHWRTGLAELRHAFSIRSFVAECRRYLPELGVGDVERSPHAGVRAQAIARDGTLVDDFLISETEHAVHLRNAPSPAATSAFALAEVIADRLDALG